MPHTELTVLPPAPPQAVHAPLAEGITRAERYYIAGTYLLPHDEQERTRLHIQHDVLKKHSRSYVADGLTLTDGDEVLDAGTGSGIWLLDLAKLVQSRVNLVGIDLEKRLFPPPQPNMQFWVQSSLDLPLEWSSKFRLVHQRLMVAAFSRDAWESAISEFYQVLKPGGYLQLEEIDFLGVLEDRAVPPLTDKFWKGARVLSEARGVSSDSLLRIPGLLRQAGFKILHTYQTRVPYGSDENARKAGIGAWRGMKMPFLQAGGFEVARTSEEYDHFMDLVEAEWQKYSFSRTYITWIARKPM